MPLKNLCLSMKSTESASSFVRYATDFMATAWAGFVGKNGKKTLALLLSWDFIVQRLMLLPVSISI